MSKFTFDEKEFDTDEISEEAKAQLQSLQFTNSELQHLQAKAAAMQTANAAYTNALKAELEK